MFSECTLNEASPSSLIATQGQIICVLCMIMNELCLKFIDIVKGKNPVFAVNANQIEIMDDPSVFYKNIVDGIRRSKKRILISSLYIGTGPMEAEIVD